MRCMSAVRTAPYAPLSSAAARCRTSRWSCRVPLARRASPPSSPASPPPAIGAAASHSLNESARAGVRAMLGFECRRAVVQEPRARHSAMPAAAAQLVCWRRSSWQLQAGVDDPHTKRKISRRPFSTCRTSWPNPEAEHATSAGAAGCRWSACQPAQPTSQTSTSTTSELGWARSTTMEPFTTDRHQHQPAASIGACDRHSLFAPQIWNTRKVASKLTTSSCSNAAVGEKVARTN